MRKGLAILIIAAFVLTGCSRDGFKASLERSSAQPQSSSQTQSEVSVPPEGFSFDIIDGGMSGTDYYMIYALPNTEDAQYKAASETIAKRIEEVLSQLPEYFDMSVKGASLEVVDGVTKNDGAIFSVQYQGEFDTDALKEATVFSFGLSFQAKTGRQLPLSEVTAPYTLAALILDGQSTSMLTKTGELAIAQREHLASVGLSALADRIVTAAPQSTVDQLMTFSYYLEGGKLVALLPVDHELGDVARIAVDNVNG